MDTLILIALGVMSRLVPHPANFTAVGGLAVFGGSRLSLPKSLVIVLLTMVISDAILGFHAVMWATYLGMAMAVFISHTIALNKGFGHVVGAAVFSSVFFFVITNLAVFVSPQTMYTKTWSGLWECYIMAIPFFANSFVSDLLYASVFTLAYQAVHAGKKAAVPKRTV